MAFVRGRVPKKLLQGPWTDDTVQFLRFLLWITGMTIDWKDADARQAAINGRKQAMKEGNREAVELFNHCRRLGKVADMDTVRYAVLECGCDQWIVYDTLLTYVTLGHEKNYYCDELDEWCAKRIQEDDLKGQWLRTRLADLRQSRSSTLRRETSIEMQNDGVDERADLLALQRSRWNRVSRPFDFGRPLYHKPSHCWLQKGVSRER